MSDHMYKVGKQKNLKKARQQQLKLLRTKLLEEKSKTLPADTYRTLHGQNGFENNAILMDESSKLGKGFTKPNKGNHEHSDIQIKISTARNSSLQVKIMEGNSNLDSSFESLQLLGVSDLTLDSVADMGITHMTETQIKVIPSLLKGRDLLATVGTGSEKALSFLIPVIEVVHKLKFAKKDGTGAIIISPTREFAVQVYTVMQELLKHHSYTYGLIIGGNNKAAEVERLTYGVNLIVTTPGRLLYHLLNTEEFVYRNLQCLIIDEADRITDLGLDEEMKQINDLLPKTRQTVLFNTGSTKKVENLARLFLKKLPLYVRDNNQNAEPSVAGLKQTYIVCPSEKRFLVLYSFLRRHRGEKVIVFLSSCMSVQFHYEMFNFMDISCACIHGKQKQGKRTKTFIKFCNAEEGFLLCTDIAARELNIPAVDWLVQYEPADDPNDYIRRLSYATQGADASAKSLLILRPEESEFLQHLCRAKVHMHKSDLFSSKVVNIQNEIQRIIQQNYFLHKSSQEAYKAYIRSYASHYLKSAFNVETLDLTKVALSFGFTVPPYVDLDVHDRKATPMHHKNFERDGKKTILYKSVKTKSKLRF